MILAAPAFSYFFKGGVFSGKTGLGYAMDRLIAEAIMYRQHVAASHALADEGVSEGVRMKCNSFNPDPEWEMVEEELPLGRHFKNSDRDMNL